MARNQRVIERAAWGKAITSCYRPQKSNESRLSQKKSLQKGVHSEGGGRSNEYEEEALVKRENETRGGGCRTQGAAAARQNALSERGSSSGRGKTMKKKSVSGRNGGNGVLRRVREK